MTLEPNLAYYYERHFGIWLDVCCNFSLFFLFANPALRLGKFSSLILTNFKTRLYNCIITLYWCYCNYMQGDIGYYEVVLFYEVYICDI